MDENSGSKEFIFTATHFTTDLLEEGPISNKIIAVQMIEEYIELNKKTKDLEQKERVYGEAIIKMKEICVLHSSGDKTFSIINENKKLKGELLIRNSSLRNFYSFLDLHIKNRLNLVPIVAVDYSLANLTFDENCYCIHTLK